MGSFVLHFIKHMSSYVAFTQSLRFKKNRDKQLYYDNAIHTVYKYWKAEMRY